MLGNILEVSSKAKRGGRVPIKIALLKIHEDTEETNKNGLHWKEEYVANAMSSVVNMPITASFADETKSVPLDHGFTGEEVDENGIREPLFENSEVVGTFESASIENIVVNDKEIKALVATGVLYYQRYPNFVKWVRKNYALGNVDTSVEIMGLEENDNKIVYEESEPTQDFRTPMSYLYSSSSIISVEPADDDAIVLEVAQKKQDLNKEENKKMELNMEELKSAIHSTIAECNNKDAEFNQKIAELNEVVEQKDTVISEKEATITELNATVEQVKKALADLEAERDAYWAERDALIKELGELKAAKRIAEMNEAISVYSEDEQKYAESEINSFKENPLESEICTITNKINAEIVANQKKAENEAIVAEQNSAKENKENETIDIFSEMCSETQDEDDEDTNIF